MCKAHVVGFCLALVGLIGISMLKASLTDGKNVPNVFVDRKRCGKPFLVLFRPTMWKSFPREGVSEGYAKIISLAVRNISRTKIACAL